MKISYFSLFLLLGVLSQNLLSATDLQKDLTNLCYEITSSDFHSKILEESKDSLDLDENIQPSLKDFAKLCRHVENISHSLQWFEKYTLDGYPGMNTYVGFDGPSLCDNIKGFLGKLLSQVLMRLNKINKNCIRDLTAFLSKLTNGPHDWPMQMLDASGKPLPGILRGAVHWVGDFNQCNSISMPLVPGNISETNPLIRGQYCTVHIAIPEYLKKMLIPANLNADLENIINSLEVKWDFCAAQHCKHAEFKYIFGPIFDLLNETYNIEMTDLTCHEPVHIFEDKTAIGSVALIGIICVFLLIGTFYDLILCCTKGSEDEFNEDISIVDENHIDAYNNFHYNNAYEMDTTSYDSSMNSLPKSKSRDDIDSGANGITPTMVQSTEDSQVNQVEDRISNRRPAPVAPVQPLSKVEAPVAPPPPTGASAQPLSKRVAPAPPPPPQSPPEAGSEVDYANLNLNQNANTFDLNGHILKINTMAPHDFLKEKTSSDRGFGSFLLAFSIRRNAYRLLNTEHPVEMLSCLNGIRFLSMAWIILGHTYKISSEDYIKNLMDGIDIYRSFTFQSVIAAPFAVDTFFLLSGILVTYFFLENYFREGNVGITAVLLIYLRRFLRLTPCYGVILMFYTCLLPNLVNGPYWKADFSESCRSRWWANMLYINNIFKLKTECMSWTWYLANDMQFFIISPIILCQFILLPSFAILTVIMLFCAYIISSVILLQKFLDPHENVSYDDIYIKPWCRISPFLIGMILGYFLQQKGRKRSFPKILQLTGWIFAIGSCLFLCYIKYTMNRKDNPVKWLDAQYIAYEVVSHPLWAMAISWVIIVCASGNGGIVSDFLGSKFWILFSRLTYGAYLIHPIVIMVAMRTSMVPFYLATSTTMYAFIGHLTVSYGLSFIVSLLFEMPVRILEKVISNRQ